jgi:hypothetical protein
LSILHLLGVDPVPGASYGDGKGRPSSFEQEGAGSGGGGGLYAVEGVNGGNSKYSPPGGKCECIPKEYCNGRPGSGSPGGVHGGNGGPDYGKGNGGGQYVDPGLTTGHGPGGSNPETDGSGNIDIRIVNRVSVNHKSIELTSNAKNFCSFLYWSV